MKLYSLALIYLIVHIVHARSPPPLNPSDLNYFNKDINYVIEDIDEIQPVFSVRTNLNSSTLSNQTDLENDVQPEARISYSGSQLWKIIIDSEEKIDVLLKLREEKGK